VVEVGSVFRRVVTSRFFYLFVEDENESEGKTRLGDSKNSQRHCSGVLTVGVT